MNRCAPHLMAALLLAASSSLVGTPVSAQTDPAGNTQPSVRQFPKTALRGELVILAAPEISMDGKADRLSPGARIRDVNDQLVLPGPLANQTLVVNYLRDNTGQVQQVWILNSEEARQSRRGRLDTLFNFSTGSSTAPADDGKTPYNQLPPYKQ